MGYKPSIKFKYARNVEKVKVTVRDAIRTAIDEEIIKDPNVFLMGEEVA